MKASTEEIRNTTRNYIKEHFLASRNIADISDSTPLITGGIMDSISTMQLISFLEKHFHIEFQPHEVDRDNFDSVDIIANFVSKKL